MKKQNPTSDNQQTNKAAKPTRVVQPAPESDANVATAVANPSPILQRAATNSQALTTTDVASLQRTVGNQALSHLTIQRKMTVGPVGDSYEQEADAVAKQVVSQLSNPAVVQRQEEDELQMKPQLQRQEDEEELQMKPLPPISTLQRQEEEELQMKPQLQRQEEEEELQMQTAVVGASGGNITPHLEQTIQTARGSGQPIAAPVRANMEQAFNTDFRGVKIHTDGAADTLNRSLSARAFTTGQDIFFRSGEYNPGNSAGQELLAHELTHTIQQGHGTIKRQPTATMPQIQRAWDVTAAETKFPGPFATLLKKMHIIPTIGRSILGRLAALTDSASQLDKLVDRIPPLELEQHLAAFPHPALLQRIVYLCPGPPRFNGIMKNIVRFGLKDEVVKLLTENDTAGLAEIDSVIDAAREAEGLKAANGKILQEMTTANFSGEHQTAVKDALDALDGTKARDWGGTWGEEHLNNEGNLPGIAGAGGYKEYYVRKGPKDSGWGGRRLVVCDVSARVYYTWTHYGDNGDPAFVRIR
jgi:hypothetical protein